MALGSFFSGQGTLRCMTDRDAIFARLAAGDLIILRRSGSNVRLWFHDSGQVWWLEGGKYLSRLDPISTGEDLPPAVVGWLDDTPAPGDPLLARARAIVAGLREAEAALQAGGWFWKDARSGVVSWPGLGPMRFGFDADGAISWFSTASAGTVRREITSSLWLGGASVRAPTAAERAAFAAEADPVVEELAAVRSGSHILCIRSPGYSRAVVWAAGRWLWVSLSDDLRFDSGAVLNPFALVCDEGKALDQFVSRRPGGQRSWVVEPMPPGLGDDLAQVGALFSTTREDIVQRYLAHIQQGGTISGGPTTDQSWTVRWGGEGYTISSYRPGESGYPEPYTRPLPEAELRRMLTRFHMFGLHRLGE